MEVQNDGLNIARTSLPSVVGISNTIMRYDVLRKCFSYADMKTSKRRLLPKQYHRLMFWTFSAICFCCMSILIFGCYANFDQIPQKPSLIQQKILLQQQVKNVTKKVRRISHALGSGYKLPASLIIRS